MRLHWLAWIGTALATLVAACAPTSGNSGRAALADLGAAPPLATENWINSPPLTLAGLRGRVVLLDFWTHGCINCRNVIPSLRGWHERYSGSGLVVIGVHAPEFPYEHDLQGLREAVTQLNIPYAVTQDNDFITWQRYSNVYWPTLYLIDKRGTIRYTYAGEGAYARTEDAIQALLAEPG